MSVNENVKAIREHILVKEEKHIDKLKVLMLAFHIDLSGVSQRPFIGRALLASITAAAIRSGLDKHQIDELYMDTVQADATPSHVIFDILPDEMERANRGVQTFYALWDAVQSMREALDKLEGDRKVVDVIYAVNATHRHDDDSTLTKEY